MKIPTRLSLMSMLMSFSIGIILLMFLAGGWATRVLEARYTGFSEKLGQAVDIHAIGPNVDDLTGLVSSYISSGDETYKASYGTGIASVMAQAAVFLDRSSPDYYAFRDLDAMLHAYHDVALAAVQGKDAGQAPIYLKDHILELRKLRGYIGDQLQLIIGGRLEETRNADRSIQTAIDAGKRDFRVTAALLALLCLILAFLTARSVAKPIHSLVERLRLIGDGQYDVPKLSVRAFGEVGILVNAFNELVLRLRDNMRAVQEQTEMAEALKKARITALESENAVKQSRLDFLQTQINPHFLYNTLNSMVTLADLEGAGKTKSMLLRLSHMMQYNLRSLRRLVTLGEEFDLAVSYARIQEIRFGGRIQFDIHADPSLRETPMPGMLLQPLMENALQHGLEPREEGGVIHVSATRDGMDVLVCVTDNGIGMDMKKLREVRASCGLPSDSPVPQLVDPETGTTAQQGRIGLSNVAQRLFLQYGETRIRIDSTPEKGTSITLLIRQERVDTETNGNA